MKREYKETSKYKPNKQVTITITNTPEKSNNSITYYKQHISINIDLGKQKSKLEFKNAKELRDYMENDIDWEEEQLELL